MDYILHTFPVTEAEYFKLNEMFGDLAHYAAWQLYRKNMKNNHTSDPEDIAQDLRMAMMRAGSYYKRQVYIEDCIAVIKRYAVAPNDKDLLALESLWKNRTKHGANRQKFGLTEEKLLDSLLVECIPIDERPNKMASLRMDTKFITYCKTITWNCQKSLGKKITREKSLRQSLTSLSEYEYLATI